MAIMIVRPFALKSKQFLLDLIVQVRRMRGRFDKQAQALGL